MTDVKGMSEEGGVDYMLEYDALAERLARYRKAFEHYHVTLKTGRMHVNNVAWICSMKSTRGRYD